jgi:hypothetical protein
MADTQKLSSNCWPWSHQWKMWEDISSGTATVGNRTGMPTIAQERRCVGCGCVELRITTAERV